MYPPLRCRKRSPFSRTCGAEDESRLDTPWLLPPTRIGPVGRDLSYLRPVRLARLPLPPVERGARRAGRGDSGYTSVLSRLVCSPCAGLGWLRSDDLSSCCVLPGVRLEGAARPL